MSINWDEKLTLWSQSAKAAGLAAKTITNYRHWICRLSARFPDLEPARFAAAVVYGSARLRDQGLSPTTVNQFQCACASFARLALRWDKDAARALITSKPVNPLPAVPTHDEVASLLQALVEPAFLPAALMYGCGLRLSEVLSLRLRDVMPEKRRVHVHAPKGGHDRWVDLPRSLVPALEKQVAQVKELWAEDMQAGDVCACPRGDHETTPFAHLRDLGNYYLFSQAELVPFKRMQRRYRVPLHQRYVQKAFSWARRKIRLQKHVTPHSLRHAFAVHSLEYGIPIIEVQKALGHAELATTAKYLRCFGLDSFRGQENPFDKWLEKTGS